jgi:hypothetical protein
MAINKVGTKGIKDGAISAIDFADNTITSGKLVNSAITNALLSNSSITLSGTSIALGASASFTNKFVQWQSVITGAGSSSTAVAGQGYFINTTSAVHTLNLPASASIGDFVAIKDYAGTFATYNLTIGRNGHNIQGVANDSLITTNRASLVLVYVDATKGWLYWEEHNVADLQVNTFISATGGTVATSGDYKIHSFTGDGCFVVSAGAGPRATVDYLVIAGGGSGGHDTGGGGGAGGFRESHSTPVSGCYSASPLATPTGITVSATTYPVTVGGGGAGGDCAPGNNGSNSVFSTITSTGGGYGGGDGGTTTRPGQPGGSGGGSDYGGTAGSGNTPPVSPPQGNPGGVGAGPPGTDGAGGGGGAGTSGTPGPAPNTAGPGGNGVSTSITGSSVTRAGGGGGSSSTGAYGTGGSGGGGDGVSNAAPNPTGYPGSANTGSGGGGGGGYEPRAGGAGGSGIVIIRYKFQ